MKQAFENFNSEELNNRLDNLGGLPCRGAPAHPVFMGLEPA